MSRGDAPAGYRAVVEHGITLVARADLYEELRAVLHAGAQDPAARTLYEWAARAPGRRALMGRAPVYAATLTRSRLPVVVRRNRHGGALARLTGERFLAPTQAPAELAISRRLIRDGVPTAEVLAYAVYGTGVLRRADVVTLEIAGGRDASTLISASDAGDRAPAWTAIARLLAALTRAGAFHHDLNVKNILLHQANGMIEAAVLDVDRVEFGDPNNPAITERNYARLVRSARKWRRLHGAVVSDDELASLRTMTADFSAQTAGVR